MFNFEIIKKDKNSKARIGILNTPHGKVLTPTLAIVATKGGIRGLSFINAKKFGADIFMINAFHFFHNRRFEIVKKFGGLHKFLGINYPIMTDSGGFQVFSLGHGLEYGVGKVTNIFPAEVNNIQKLFKKRKNTKSLVKIYEEGVEFISPYNGEKLFLTPELSIKIQKDLGADIIFSFDECTSPFSNYEYTKQSTERTNRWALRCLNVFGNNSKQAIFGIIQGGDYEDLRKLSANFINSLPFFGFGIGGYLGKSKSDIVKILKWIMPLLDENKPKHLLGVGEIDDILNSVEEGVDLFDCIIPTRLARHGCALSYNGKLNLRPRKFLLDKKPIDPDCKCNVCQRYSRAYICHLLREKEIFGIMLLVEHNVFWILNIFKEIKKAIRENKFLQFKRKILKNIKK